MKKTKIFMDTVVDIEVVTGSSTPIKEVESSIESAFDQFRKVEEACSRFSSESELMNVSREIATPVPISPYLFEPLRFAVEMARLTEGKFDPTIGKIMEGHGFNRHYLTGVSIQSPSDKAGTFHDIILDETSRSLLLKKPLVIDLGAVAKGFAIDLAANELKKFNGFIVNAGGDLYAGGTNSKGNPWKIGIQHPNNENQIIHTIEVSNKAVCTSGGYERRSTKQTSMHHIIDPKTMESPNGCLSSTVIAPFAMMADAFSTVSILLGPEKGKKFIEDMELIGLLVLPELQIVHVGGTRDHVKEMD